MTGLRILYVIDSLGGGGAESVLHNLVLYLRDHERSINAEVVTLYRIGHFGKRLISAGIQVHCLELGSKYSPLGAWRLVQFVRSRPYDLVHVHLFPANYLAAIASLGFPRLPWIYTEHSVWTRRRRYPPLRLLEAAVYSRFDKVIAVSDSVAENLIRWVPTVRTKLQVIPNAIPVPSADEIRTLKSGNRSTSPVILFVGRLHDVKGIDVLLKALTRLPTVDYELQIAGDGDLCSFLEALAVELGVRHKVEFLGFRSDVQSLMASAHCMVMPSRWEGLPMVLLEAMAMGLPVIGSAVGGIPEVIEHGVTGWLVSPEDPNGLAAALLAVLKDPETSRQIGLNAREKIRQDYSIEKMSQRMLNLYTQELAH